LHAVVVQKLPFLNQTSESLYLVYAGYQDYFFSLYDSILTPRQTLTIVPDVVQSISNLIEVSKNSWLSSRLLEYLDTSTLT
jgi:hypothetical protein